MIITQTPLRVSFGGGGTDLAAYYEAREGYVVNAAIDKAVFVVVTERYDDMIYVNYSRKEMVEHVDQIQHELVREAMRIAGVKNGVEVTMLSDIPSQGSGLGSSSSFTVGLLNAFHQYAHQQVGPAQLAEEACEIEIVRCGKPIGKQDQYIAAFGGVHGFRFKKDGSVEAERLTPNESGLRELSARLLLFFSDITRKADSILSEQRQQTGANLEFLDGIKDLASEARQAIVNGEFDRIGQLLDKNWTLKKRLTDKISNSRLDEMHHLAMESGASGAKICGAG
ncbi:MAG: GHMP kinase, partial [Candidatus Hydrogenedentes bacterium]|nr:GHMP kinase [Candidatus Hydrogenedentota bacterium]